ncbi:unnamed protein product [Bursaphelenchus okinawaensis]|uniref:Transposase Tc1-like domain-containing protein n=1 Tax=Bursaphelenchus okinawaensis TaxID=465554 RepID=A0A811LUK3_9BILA|nr:unnamed protein product [Bursaphelenchus okinawaensis]CAG9128314.1 unnamed protein product [Bursaphelenchus okinawaensis]
MLTQEERNEIVQIFEKTGNITEVRRRAGHSRNTVKRIISNVSNKKVGRPANNSPAAVRRIKRFVEKEVRAGHKVTAKIIKENLKLDSSLRTIHTLLKENGITYEVTKRQLPLSRSQMVYRANFAKKHLDQKTNFCKWIFSDRKRFSFDGPDYLACYGTYNARLKRIKRQAGGGSVMALGAIFSNGNIKVNTFHGPLSKWVVQGGTASRTTAPFTLPRKLPTF